MSRKVKLLKDKDWDRATVKLSGRHIIFHDAACLIPRKLVQWFVRSWDLDGFRVTWGPFNDLSDTWDLLREIEAGFVRDFRNNWLTILDIFPKTVKRRAESGRLPPPDAPSAVILPRGASYQEMTRLAA